MRKLILALAVFAGSVTTVEASTTSISAVPTSSVAGQSVTFTATFTSSCPGALTTHYFTIDGQGVNGSLAQTGLAGTETLSISTLKAGPHTITYYWKINGTICRGIAEMSYTIMPEPSPTPSPSPSPSPTSSPTPAPSPVALVAKGQSDAPLLGYLGGALIVLVVAVGAALMVLARR
jgi:hypothetical protein